MLEAIGLLVVGLALLVWSADKLVFGSAAVARNFGISPLVIGMTIIAMGSSAPELVVSITAALDGKADTAVGNVLGSNITNIALILGVTALIRPLAISSKIIYRELPLLLAVCILCGVILANHYLGFTEGIILLIVFIGFLWLMKKASKDVPADDPIATCQAKEATHSVSNLKAGFWVVVGLALLIFSAGIVVDSAVVIAKAFGMSDLTIGLTIIAVGTSLPELAASIASSLKGEDDMAVGNIIGSNIFNILMVMGVPALLAPAALNPLAMNRDFYAMLALTLLLFVFAIGKSRVIHRWEGLILLLSFITYQGYLFFNMAA